MKRKFRFLPIAIMMLSMVLGVKVVDFSFGIESSLAQASAPEPAAGAAEPDAATPADDQDVPKAEGENSGPETRLLSVNPTRTEIEYLQKLSERRQELERRARELDDRERMLEAVEMRIVERTESLKQIEQKISGLLTQHDAQQKAQLDSLVKIYSAMRPKEAAQIFNRLEEGVLISIVENMKERTMGAILAKMELNKAKELTATLAKRQQLPDIEG